MRNIFLFCICFFFTRLIYAQKPPIDFHTPETWPALLGRPTISNNGKYVYYITSTAYHKTLSANDGSTITIESLDQSFKKEIKSATLPTFTDDSRGLLYMNPGNALCLLGLQKGDVQSFPNTKSYTYHTYHNDCWLGILSEGTVSKLILINTSTSKKMQFDSVRNFTFSPDNKIILIERKLSDSTYSLERVNLKNGVKMPIYNGDYYINQLATDSSGDHIAFITKAEIDSGSNAEYVLYYFKQGMNKAEIGVSKATKGLEPKMELNNSNIHFNSSGSILFFHLQEESYLIKAKMPKANVSIWSYKDVVLKSIQKKLTSNLHSRIYLSDIIENEHGVNVLSRKGDANYSIMENVADNSNYLLIRNHETTDESVVDSTKLPDVFLVNTLTGERICLLPRIREDNCSFSPTGRFVSWYDQEKKSYYFYDIQSKKTKSLNADFGVKLYDELYDHAAAPFEYGIGGWTKCDAGVYIYDRYDIWLVDPNGVKSPVNITHGFGRKNKLVLRLATANKPFGIAKPSIQVQGNLLLTAFNEVTKENGFYILGGNDNLPTKLFMGPYDLYFPDATSHTDNVKLSDFLSKAKNANIYLLEKMSATEYPNIVYTRDFESFNNLTDLRPQQKYNWMTSSLLRYQLPNGKIGESILYKPENFDSSRKYPVIFYFYEKNASGLHKFLTPDLADGPMNIPWFVSNGYIVCVPDIYFVVGNTGESVYGSVVSAANYLKKFSWVDGKRLGLQGHSMGGYEVNELITRTNMFTAACSAAGLTDGIGLFGLMNSSGYSYGPFCMTGQMRLGSYPWNNSKVYIDNSPMLKVNKVNTPLLMMDNPLDVNVPPQQGFEFFTALRLLGKKVWMLEYSDEVHTLVRKENQLDYSIRMSQFFDYYLKGAPAPKWMTDSIGWSFKDANSSYDLDTSGKNP